MSRLRSDDPSFWRNQDEPPHAPAVAPQTPEPLAVSETTGGSEQLLTRAEVAALFQVCQETVSNWVRRGLLRPVGPGRGLRFRQRDLEDLIGRKSGESQS